ncbi:MAG: hypothetical protein R3D67_10195 [Hyphomicrobiaceae bacterium]
MIFGGLGGYEKGWPDVGERLRWAATKVEARLLRVENLSTVIIGDTRITADLEHMVRRLDGREFERALRVTHGIRIEDGAWRIFLQAR